MIKKITLCICFLLSACASSDKKPPLIKPEIKYEQRTEKMTLVYNAQHTHAKNIKLFKYKTDQKSFYGKTTIHVYFPETESAAPHTKLRMQKIKEYLLKERYRNNQIHETNLLEVKGNSIPILIKIYQAFPPVCDSTLYQENYTHCAYLRNMLQMTEDISVFFVDNPMGPVHSAPLINAISEIGYTDKSASENNLDGSNNDGDNTDDETGAPSLKDIVGGSSNPLGGGLLSALGKN